MIEICECGDVKGSHQHATRKSSSVGYCHIKYCKCNKFKLKVEGERWLEPILDKHGDPKEWKLTSHNKK